MKCRSVLNIVYILFNYLYGKIKSNKLGWNIYISVQANTHTENSVVKFQKHLNNFFIWEFYLNFVISIKVLFCLLPSHSSHILANFKCETSAWVSNRTVNKTSSSSLLIFTCIVVNVRIKYYSKIKVNRVER